MENSDIKFIGSIIKLYDSLEKQGISLVYLGKFNHKITKMFTALSGDETDLNNEEIVVKRKLHHTVVEILQNMTKHSTKLFTKVNFGKGMFILGKKSNAYYIITANKVSLSEKKNLTSAIEEVNAATHEELKEMYKKQLVEGVISRRGGAGLGLIDIARKTRNKLEYHFLPLNSKQKYFILKVKVDTKIQKRKISSKNTQN